MYLSVSIYFWLFTLIEWHFSIFFFFSVSCGFSAWMCVCGRIDNRCCVSTFIVDVAPTVFLCIGDADRPVCRHDQKRIYGVARNEMAKILCEVDAYPAPTSFKWSFNNTAETIDMPQNGFEKHSRTSSRLSYTPVKVCYLSLIILSNHILAIANIYLQHINIVEIKDFLMNATYDGSTLICRL